MEKLYVGQTISFKYDYLIIEDYKLENPEIFKIKGMYSPSQEYFKFGQSKFYLQVRSLLDFPIVYKYVSPFIYYQKLKRVDKNTMQEYTVHIEEEDNDYIIIMPDDFNYFSTGYFWKVPIKGHYDLKDIMDENSPSYYKTIGFLDKLDIKEYTNFTGSSYIGTSFIQEGVKCEVMFIILDGKVLTELEITTKVRHAILDGDAEVAISIRDVMNILPLYHFNLKTKKYD